MCTCTYVHSKYKPFLIATILAGMYRFVLQEHKATYDLFCREHTGKLLDKSKPIMCMYSCAMYNDLLLFVASAAQHVMCMFIFPAGTNLKRKASTMSTKEVPKTKALKREEWESVSVYMHLI